MVVVDPRFGQYMDLKDYADAGEPHLFGNLVCTPQPCHGLNVGSCSSWDFVCNPVMGYCQYMEPDIDDDILFAGRMGLGFDSDIEKHVLVRITYKEKNLETREYELQCKFRYVENQEWCSIDPPPRPIADISPAYASGKIYWMVDPELGQFSLSCEIVAFNVETDEFEVLQGPPCSHEKGRMSILQIGGALCMACSNKSMNVIDIWRMKDIGTWLIEYHIELSEFSPEYSSENTTPLAVNPKDGRILLNTGLSLGYYDPKMAALETIYSEGILDHAFKICPIICDESLVCPLGPP
jgi:F-box interacting protein